MRAHTKASRARRPSGRFLLRIDPGLHAALRQAAREAGMSLNDYCARRLAAPAGNVTALRPATDVIARAGTLFGGALLGVIAYGSWARAEVTPASDVDVLIVVEPSLPLTRDLYRRWDEGRLAWNGRAIDPHIVHPPAHDARVTALWAEAAIDGLVLFERGLSLSIGLARIRRAIFTGQLVRRVVHGQPYWAEAS